MSPVTPDTFSAAIEEITALDFPQGVTVFGDIRIDFTHGLLGQTRILTSDFFNAEDDDGTVILNVGACNASGSYFTITLPADQDETWNDPLTDDHKELIFNAVQAVDFNWNYTDPFDTESPSRWTDKAAKVTRVSDYVVTVSMDADSQQGQQYETASADYTAIYFTILSRPLTPGTTDPIVPVSGNTFFRSGNVIPLFNDVNAALKGHGFTSATSQGNPSRRINLTLLSDLYEFYVQLPDNVLDSHEISIDSVSNGQEYYIRELNNSFFEYVSYTATASDTTSSVCAELVSQWNTNLAEGIGPPLSMTCTQSGSTMVFATSTAFFPSKVGVASGMTLSSSAFTGEPLRTVMENWSGTCKIYNEDRSTEMGSFDLSDLIAKEDPTRGSGMVDSDLSTWLSIGSSPAVWAGWDHDASDANRGYIYVLVQSNNAGGPPSDQTRLRLVIDIDDW